MTMNEPGEGTPSIAPNGDDSPPLDGLRIIEGSAFVAAPLGGMTLAQLGADVIRFDNVGGGIDFHRWPCTANGSSLFWAGMNKGKRSIAVDLTKPAGRELVTELITASGDDRGVLLSNFPQAGWLSDEKLRARRPDLIYVNILGNPDGGSAVDYTVNPASGIAFATGPSDASGPTNHVLPAWDIATGLTAAVGLLAAERHRWRRGGGQLVTVSLADVAFTMVANLGYLAQAGVLDEDRPPIGNDLYGAFGRDFVTADGRRIMVVAISLKQWLALAAATGITDHLVWVEDAFGVDLNKEGDRFQARNALGALIGNWISSHTLDEAAEQFDDHGVCWGPYQTFRQLLHDDWRVQPESNPVFRDVFQPGIGKVRVGGSPLSFSALLRTSATPAPRLGEHTAEILATELGLSSAEIGRLFDSKLVAGPPSS